ncbi:MAG: hypothetical protein LBC04_00060 [Holosporaceae bacterium]|jgi:hypothetical protein|nr:hypothetical protein [Holosporaceae bacterium]
MKKIMLASLMSTFALSVSAEDGAVIGENSSLGEATRFDGLYLGFGLGGSSLRNKAEVVEIKVGQTTIDRSNKTLNKLNSKGIFGVAALGAGKVIREKWYLGGEVSLDFGKSKSKKIEPANDWTITVGGVVTTIPKGTDTGITMRNRGITPELAFRAGYVVKGAWLIYFKPSLYFPQTKLKWDEGKKTASISKARFAVALGIEHPFCEKFTARVEIGHGSKSSKEFTVERDGSTKFKATSGRGFTLRALVTYNLSHFMRS